MKTLLLFPPVWNVHAPYLALPLLAANLRKSGNEVDIMDCNIDFFDRILSPEYLHRALGRAESILRKPEKGTLENAMREMAVFMGPELINSITVAKERYRSMEALQESACYEWSRNIIGASVNLVSSSFKGLKINFNGVSFKGLSFSNSRELLNFVKDSNENNIFAEYYGEIVKPLIKKNGYGLVGLSVADRGQLMAALTFAIETKRAFDDSVKIVFGGNFFTRIAKRWKEPHPFQGFIDYIILMEGENAIVELVESLKDGGNLKRVSNLCYTENGNICYTDNRNVDINNSPFPDFSGFPLNRYFLPKLVLPSYMSRSCPWNKCTFCTIADASGKFRARSAQRIVEEIEFLQNRHSTSYFTFVDESLSPGLVRKMSGAIIEKGLDIKWYGEARLIPGFDDEVLGKAWQSGARLLQFGLESYNQRILDLINKGVNEKDIIPLLKRCLSKGISFHLFCILGFPMETTDEAMRTLSFLDEIISMAESEYQNPYCTKGLSTFGMESETPIHKDPERFGVKIIPSDENNDLALDLKYEVSSGLSSEDVQQLLDKYTGINVFTELAEKLSIFFCNRMIPVPPQKEEESFVRWSNYKEMSLHSGRKDKTFCIWDANFDNKADIIKVAPWIKIKDVAYDFTTFDHARNNAAFVYNLRKGRVFCLTQKQKMLLEKIGDGRPNDWYVSLAKEDRSLYKNLIRLVQLGVITMDCEEILVDFKEDKIIEASLLPFEDISFHGISGDRHVLLDRAREKVVALNHTGALIWTMIGNEIRIRLLLASLQQIYGKYFQWEHLSNFLRMLYREEVLFLSRF
ncbi:MAG: radical SAM protein [Candidatus Loosdrechtia sp.]|uniref:radical SAM protein n=1 Tax=Candidatus Loosdrechtia sp. TaxID=3101272 RepID=UPI003A666ECB|nr:MAG: radical SAM protein [Candidatus Jettenia sp. AMX2]